MLYYPRRLPSQNLNTYVVKNEDDIDVDPYHKWELAALKKREVTDELEAQRLRNKMMFVLTGDPKYGKESKSKAAKITHQRRRKSKRSTFFTRPDRSVTQMRQSQL